MRSLIKFSLLIFACLSTTEMIHPSGAIAGDKPVALPDSGSSSISDTFSPERRGDNGSRTTDRISRELAEALRMIQTRQSVASVNGQQLLLSSEELTTLSAAVSTGVDIEALEQQLKMEMGGLELEISALTVSPDNLAAAVQATNEVVLSLNSEQLAAAIGSPIFIALLRLLKAANQTTVESDVREMSSQESRPADLADISTEQGALSLLQISRP